MVRAIPPKGTRPAPGSAIARGRRLSLYRYVGEAENRMDSVDEASWSALGAEEIARRLQTMQGWATVHERLVKTFSFNGFVSAVRFVDRLTEVAEQQGHHPDLWVSWGKVRVELRTHTAAAITEADFRLATAIDALS